MQIIDFINSIFVHTCKFILTESFRQKVQTIKLSMTFYSVGVTEESVGIFNETFGYLVTTINIPCTVSQ